MNRIISSIEIDLLKYVNPFYVKSLNIMVYSDFLYPYPPSPIGIVKRLRDIKDVFRTLQNIYDGVIEIFSNEANILKNIAIIAIAKT